MHLLAPHLVLAFLTLLIASIIDIRSRRIPNLLLLSSGFVHLIFWRVDGLDFRGGVVALIVATALIIAPFSGPWILKNCGMGDIKLLIYMMWSMGKVINWSSFLIALGLTSLLVAGAQLTMRRRINCSIPFAPVLAIGGFSGVFL